MSHCFMYMDVYSSLGFLVFPLLNGQWDIVLR